LSITVHIARTASEGLVDDLNHLLPQLSSSAAPLTVGTLNEMLSSNAITLFVARQNERVIGTLTLAIFPIPTGLRAWIEDVVVDRDSRGFGVGDALTTAAVAHATELGVRSIDLTSRPSREAANALYVKLGFELRKTNVYRFSVEATEEQ